jgi:hypothetical protein
MKRVILSILILLIGACVLVPSQGSSSPGGIMETIEETTVGNLDGTRVGVSNIWERQYNLPDGISRLGMTAILSPFNDKDVVVGQGSIVTIGQTQWEVITVEKTQGKRGEVRLKKL